MERIGEKIILYGSADANNILLMPADRSEMEDAERYYRMLKELTGVPFSLLFYRIDDWNRELSPWPAPPVYGKEPFSGEAERTLREMTEEAGRLMDGKRILIGGYSLAGFFALWAAYATDLFGGAAAVSPSVWYPGWTEFAEEHAVKAKMVYLSLGEKEEKTRHPVLSKVGNCIRRQEELLRRDGAVSALEWNPGGHFQDPGQRTVKGFAWLLDHLPEK